MQIITKVMKPNHEIILGGDAHTGSILQEANALQAMIEDVGAHPDTYFVGMGDYLEARAVDHRFFCLRTHKATVTKQIKYTRKLLRPIRKKIIGLLEGNHERDLHALGDVTELICDDLSVHYGTYTSVIVIQDEAGKTLYKIFAWHGRGTIKSRIDDPGERLHSMKRALRRKLQFKMADCEVMAMGHTHRLIVIPPITNLDLYTDHTLPRDKKIKSFYSGDEVGHRGDIPRSGRWYVNTGGFLKMYAEGVSGYAEAMDCDPLEIGYAKIICRAGKVVDIKPVMMG